MKSKTRKQLQMFYPSHVIVPSTTKGITENGIPLPWGPVTVGRGPYSTETWLHAPILYDDTKVYKLLTSTPRKAPSSFNVTYNSTLGTLTWNHRTFYPRVFINGISQGIATTTIEEDTEARKVIKLTGPYSVAGGTTATWTMRIMLYPNCSMARIQNNIVVPYGDTQEMGFELLETFTRALSNLGVGTSQYNTDADGEWDGWVGSNGVFLSIRDAQTKWPRGFSIGSGTVDDGSSIQSGMVARWSFDESSGNRADSVGGNTLIPYSGTVTRTTGKVGSTPYGLSIANVYTDFNAGDSAGLSPTGDFTIAFWIKLNAKTHLNGIVSKYDLNVSGSRSFLVDYSSGTDRFRFTVRGSAETTVSNTFSPTVGVWYHVVARHNNGANIKIRVSTGATPGTDVTSAHTTGVQNTTTDFMVGNITRAGIPDSGGLYLDGVIDELQIWNRSISDSEVLEVFNGGSGREYSTTTKNALKLYQHFTNGTRVVAGDYTYDTIPQCRYLHQGDLNLKLPAEYVTAIDTDAAILAEANDSSGTHSRDYDYEGVSSTLDILLTFYEPANQYPRNRFLEWHDAHQRGPIVSLVDVYGMKRSDFPEVEAVIKRDMINLDGQFTGQFLYGDYPEKDGSPYRCRMNNHYWHIEAAFFNFLRTRDNEIQIKAREYLNYYRDMCALVTSGITTFAHGKSILPWIYRTSQAHWIGPTALLLAWQVEGDRLSKDKYDYWRPSVWITGIDRETKGTIYHGTVLKDYLGQDYTDLATARAALESTEIQTQGTGFYWHPLFLVGRTTYARAQTYRELNYEGIATLFTSILDQNPDRHYHWLSRVDTDHTAAVKTGPIGDQYLALQWGFFLDELRRQGIDSFEYWDEMPGFPVLFGQTYSNTSHKSCEVIFTKPHDDPTTIRIMLMSFGGDVQYTSVRYRRPDSTLVTLGSGIKTGVGTVSVTQPSLRGGIKPTTDYQITGPAGEYRIIITSNEVALLGDITDYPEYSVVQAGSKSMFAQGWFKTENGTPEYIEDCNLANFDDDNILIQRNWPNAGYFAKRKEWLP